VLLQHETPLLSSNQTLGSARRAPHFWNVDIHSSVSRYIFYCKLLIRDICHMHWTCFKCVWRGSCGQIAKRGMSSEIPLHALFNTCYTHEQIKSIPPCLFMAEVWDFGRHFRRTAKTFSAGQRGRVCKIFRVRHPFHKISRYLRPNKTFFVLFGRVPSRE
jgi:hypothetical protein